jgi:hypothetical protein
LVTDYIDKSLKGFELSMYVTLFLAQFSVSGEVEQFEDFDD